MFLGLAIMLFDVAVDSYAAYVSDIIPDFFPLQLHTLFLGFLLCAAPMLCGHASGRRLRADAAGQSHE